MSKTKREKPPKPPPEEDDFDEDDLLGFADLEEPIDDEEDDADDEDDEDPSLLDQYTLGEEENEPEDFEEPETESWDLDNLLDDDSIEPTEDLAVLPWRIEASLPEEGITLPTILDPTASTSRWIIPSPPEQRKVLMVVRLKDLEFQVELIVEQGSSAQLRLGRDALAGRVLVRAED